MLSLFLIRVSHTNVSWWSFTGDWVTTSLLKSPGLFSVFWPSSIMLLFGCPPLGRQLPNPPDSLKTFSYCAKSTNHNWYHRHFHVPCFFYSLARSRYWSLFSLSFSFILWSSRTAKSTILRILSFLLLIIIRSGLLAEIRWSVFTWKSQRSLCVSFSRTGAGLCIYHLLVWSNLNFLHISQLILLLLFTPSEFSHQR